MDDSISRKWLMESVDEGWIKFDTEKDENRFIHLVRDIAPSAQQTGAECVATVTIEEDGTLMVTVGKNENISRVIVLYGDSIFCGVFYPDGEKDGDENDFISRQDAQNKLIKLVNEFEGILSDIRMREGNDCVCGLCEYDGAYIGESGDWCNECPGFEKDDCFMLKEKYRKEWMEVKNERS